MCCNVLILMSDIIASLSAKTDIFLNLVQIEEFSLKITSLRLFYILKRRSSGYERTLGFIIKAPLGKFALCQD